MLHKASTVYGNKLCKYIIQYFIPYLYISRQKVSTYTSEFLLSSKYFTGYLYHPITKIFPVCRHYLIKISGMGRWISLHSLCIYGTDIIDQRKKDRLGERFSGTEANRQGTQGTTGTGNPVIAVLFVGCESSRLAIKKKERKEEKSPERPFMNTVSPALSHPA